ncbi:hypothetical protein Zmor_009925 [Zophobas morio]|uniref:Uncharacterized protein n=1 Tax=Zophobas morio TaxID=2755281 RepID=A0AA38IHX7_9CUCU|nr:hypothetical protein Zmor_009925 [Zophobas morio]
MPAGSPFPKTGAPPKTLPPPPQSGGVRLLRSAADAFPCRTSPTRQHVPSSAPSANALRRRLSWRGRPYKTVDQARTVAILPQGAAGRHPVTSP